MTQIDADAAELAANRIVPWSELDGHSIMITGATGLIGSTLVRALATRNSVYGADIRIYALVRNESRAKDEFDGLLGVDVVRWDAMNVGAPSAEADVVIHCASLTSSKGFMESPVEVMETVLVGTRTMLEYCRAAKARMLFLSTMEIYGECPEGVIKEDQGGFLDSGSLRSSYPEAKRAAETLCEGYAHEYGVDVSIVRLAQTFGPGVKRDDGRVFAEFARDCMSGQDIVLLTEGTKRNMYLYTTDAASALLLLAARGGAGEVYNAANPETFCSIREMAERVALAYGDGKVQVRIQLDPKAARRFRKGSVLELDVSKLEGLGWTPRVGLAEMYGRLMTDWSEHA
jgi:nucleoside-diphosphate-sugar epimerase